MVPLRDGCVIQQCEMGYSDGSRADNSAACQFFAKQNQQLILNIRSSAVSYESRLAHALLLDNREQRTGKITPSILPLLHRLASRALQY